MRPSQIVGMGVPNGVHRVGVPRMARGAVETVETRAFALGIVADAAVGAIDVAQVALLTAVLAVLRKDTVAQRFVEGRHRVVRGRTPP